MKRIALLILLLSFGLAENHAQSNPPPITHDAGWIRGAVFSRDSQRILSWGGDTARIWDVSTGEVLFEVSPRPAELPPYPGGGLNTARWNEDETQLTVTYQYGSHSAFRTVWDIQTGDQLSSEVICTALCGSPSSSSEWFNESSDATGSRIATWNNASCSDDCDHTLTVTDTNSETLILPHEQRIKHAYWSPSGNYLISTTVPECADCITPMYIWSMNPAADNYGGLLATPDTTCLVWDLQWSNDERQFYLRSDGLWREAFSGMMESCHASWQAFSINGDLLWQHDALSWQRSHSMYLNEAENSLIISGYSTPSLTDEQHFPVYEALRLDISTGTLLETQLLTGYAPDDFAYRLIDTELTIWDLRTLEIARHFELTAPLKTYTDGAWTPDGSERLAPEFTWLEDYNLVYARTIDDTLYVWNTQTWDSLFTGSPELLFRIPVFDEENQTLTIIGTERCEVFCSSSAWLFDLETHQILFSTENLNEPITEMRRLDENRVAVLTGCSTCTANLYVYDIETGELILQDEGDHLSVVETSEHWLVVRDFSGYAVPLPSVPFRIWDIENGELRLSTDAFGYELSPQETRILIYGEDVTSVYDLITGERLIDFPFPPGNRGIWDWSPDERTIIFRVGLDQLADIYSVDSGEWLFPNRRG